MVKTLPNRRFENSRRCGASIVRLRTLLLTAFLVAGWPAIAALQPDEAVVLYPALAWPSGDNWRVDLKGIVYEPGEHPHLAALFRKLLGLSDDEMSDAERQLFRLRSGSFLIDNERGKKLALEVAGETVRLRKSEPNGHFERVFALTTKALATNGLGPMGGILALSTSVASGTALARTYPITIHFLPAEGWSVISDIDDTIKVSHVRDKKALIRSTFCQPFTAVPGMAAAYQNWAEAGARFHYVSASPWQLYPALDEFVRSNGFPAGTFHMKLFRLKDTSALQMLGSQNRYKLRTIEALLSRFPARQFVLVGDSGEQDPEIYGELARRHRQQVCRIHIRNVTEEGASASRYKLAFQGVPVERWNIFEHGSTLTNRSAWPELFEGQGKVPREAERGL